MHDWDYCRYLEKDSKLSFEHCVCLTVWCYFNLLLTVCKCLYWIFQFSWGKLFKLYNPGFKMSRLIFVPLVIIRLFIKKALYHYKNCCPFLLSIVGSQWWLLFWIFKKGVTRAQYTQVSKDLLRWLADQDIFRSRIYQDE